MSVSDALKTFIQDARVAEVDGTISVLETNEVAGEDGFLAE